METINIIDKSFSILIIFFISTVFAILGIFYSRNFKDLSNYLVANRSMGVFSLTFSLVSSALGAWILFGPASAATWGGIGAVIGYALGTAFPLFIMISLGSKVRNQYPDGKTLTEVVRLKFGNKLFKLILLLSIFYMIIFLIAEVTAVAILIKYLAGTPLWITSIIIITSSLAYTLYGGLRASIFTDNIQFLILITLLIISFWLLISYNSLIFNFEYIKENQPNLLSYNNYTNFTAGFTFFLAVSATNLFHQGNWQRIYAAQNNKVLKKSLIISFILIIPIVFLMGFTGLVAISSNKSVVPDLSFFYLLFSEKTFIVSLIVIFLAISLTISSIDTLINAISSIIIVDVKDAVRFKGDSLIFSKIILIFISLIAFAISSKGISILYLFLLADLFCCSAVLSVFLGFYRKKVFQKSMFSSILLGLFWGLLFFPYPDFSKSLLVGVIIPKEYFPEYISNSLLFLSFLMATFLPIISMNIVRK